MNQRLKSTLIFALKLVVTIVPAYFVFSNISLYIFPSSISPLKQNVNLSYGRLLKLYFVGLFFNNFMPGNVGGDFKKVYDIRVQGGQDSVGAGLTATFFDRIFGLFFLNALALGVGALFFVYY